MNVCRSKNVTIFLLFNINNARCKINLYKQIFCFNFCYKDFEYISNIYFKIYKLIF